MNLVTKCRSAPENLFSNEVGWSKYWVEIVFFDWSATTCCTAEIGIRHSCKYGTCRPPGQGALAMVEGADYREALMKLRHWVQGLGPEMEKSVNLSIDHLEEEVTKKRETR